MPKYSKGRGRKKLVKKKKKFSHPYDVIHALAATPPEGFKQYRNMAKDYLSGDKVPPAQLSREALGQMVDQNQKFLTQQAAHEFHDGGGLGGGISTATAVIGRELSHLTGANEFFDWVGKVKKPKKYPSFEAQVAAFLVDKTYEKVGSRPDKALMYERLGRYDTEHCSVWRNRNTDELLLTVRGTKLKASDLGQDLQILLGGIRVEDQEFRNIMNKLKTDYPNQKYDVAAHSLGCVYVMQEAGAYDSQWDQTFLFNAPSSPAQDDAALRDRINNPNLNYYSSHGDILGLNTVQLMNNETLEETTWMPWKFSPLACHSISSWYPSSFVDAPATSTAIDNQPSTVETAEYQQDTPETQAANLS